MDSRFTRWCDAFLEACWLAAILTTPLFFDIYSERVFEPDKLALLRSIALLMVTVWGARFISQGDWRDLKRFRFSNPDAFWHKPLVLPVFGIILIYLLATLFSVNPSISWAGSYQRLQGTYTTLSYIAFFTVIATTLRRPEQVRRITSVAIIASVPVAILGILQHYGLDPLPWGGNVQTRVTGQMGNAIFIAAYLIMIIPLTLARIIEGFRSILTDKQLIMSSIISASIYVFIMVIQLLTLYWSGSRGPLLGLTVGLFSFILVLLVSLRNTHSIEQDIAKRFSRDLLMTVLFLAPTIIALPASKTVSDIAGPWTSFLFFFGVVAISVMLIFGLILVRRSQRWMWAGWIGLTILLAGWLLAFNIPAERSVGLRNIVIIGDAFDVMDEWRNLPTIGTFGRMLDPSETTGREKSGRVRILIWQGVIELIKPHAPLEYPDGTRDVFNWLRPIIGFGPESMYSVYNKVYPPELASVEARNASPDRSHNETFDSLVITGIAGLVAWQILYLAAVLYAFRFLGVVRSRRDSWIMGTLWIGGAAIASLLTVTLANPIYLGVAVPVGVILGVVVYLIYYALFGDSGKKEMDNAERAPFAHNSLVMNALVAAVLAHYVEIHFGIAISVTRLYFFVFVGLMVALGHQLASPALEVVTESNSDPASSDQISKKKRRARRSPNEASPPSAWQPLLAPALLLVLLIGTLGFGFISYALPPGKTISGPSDLTIIEIFRQSLLQNPRQGFIGWPYIMAMIVLSWATGWIIFLTDLLNAGDLELPKTTTELTGKRKIAAAGSFIALALLTAATLLIYPAGYAPSSFTTGLSAILIVGCLIVGTLVLTKVTIAREVGAIAATALIIIAFPVLISGGLILSLLMLLAGLLTLWNLWDHQWRNTLLPSSGVILASLLGGILTLFLMATNYRSVLLFRSGPPSSSIIGSRVMGAVRMGELLVFFYGFVFLLIFLIAFALVRARAAIEHSQQNKPATRFVLGGFVAALIIAMILVWQTNIRPVQADMIFKQARPYDEQATRAAQVDLALGKNFWDTAIAIYEAAIERSPKEDYYYLFLGRAYLERAAITEDLNEQNQFLTRAENLLIRAQSINPLNTDHTANLARLNTRWYAVVDDPTERADRLSLADSYYRIALVLSPQNSVIRNEYARLVLDATGDCDRALSIYDESLAIDPYYTQTLLSQANALLICADRSGANRDAYYRRAIENLEIALQRNMNNTRTWFQLAQIQMQIGDFEQALTSIQSATKFNDPVVVPPAEIEFMAAQITVGLGDIKGGRAIAERALETAGDDLSSQINAFLDELKEE